MVWGDKAATSVKAGYAGTSCCCCCRCGAAWRLVTVDTRLWQYRSDWARNDMPTTLEPEKSLKHA